MNSIQTVYTSRSSTTSKLASRPEENEETEDKVHSITMPQAVNADTASDAFTRTVTTTIQLDGTVEMDEVTVADAAVAVEAVAEDAAADQIIDHKAVAAAVTAVAHSTAQIAASARKAAGVITRATRKEQMLRFLMRKLQRNSRTSRPIFRDSKQNK